MVIQAGIRQRFRQSLRCGTGEAYLILQEHPGYDFTKDIEKAALTNYAYDPQCEGDRAYYVSQLIELSGRKEAIVEAVLKALATEREDTWNLDQLFALAAIFAKQGNAKARQAIYKRYHKNVIKGSEWVGEEEILELDGMQGLLHVAEVRGRALTEDPEEWEDSFLVDCFQEDHPEIPVYQELRTAAKGNAFIKKYLDMIRKHPWSGPERPARPKFDYAFVKERIEKKIRVPATPNVVRQLSKADIKRLADDFLQEGDFEKRERYLSVFTNTPFPYGYQPILKMAQGKSRRGSRVVWLACRSLKFFEAKAIRQFALAKLPVTRQPAVYLPLLVSNYKKGDYRLLVEIAERNHNEHMIHDMIWGYIAIYRANKTRHCKQPLETLYRKLTCGLHRYDLLKILYENGVLSKTILREMKYDSEEDNRELYHQICKSRV